MRRNAVLFVAISLLSGFGSTAMSLVASIWILDLTGSPGRAALGGLCVYAPQLTGPWLGGLLDRLPRRPLLIATNLLLAASLLSLLAVRTPAQTWLIFAVSLCYGVSYLLLDAGETALLPSALSDRELGEVNGWRSSAQEGMKLVAPAAGAGLYAWQGGAAVAVLSAAMPILAAVLYAALRLRPTAALAGPGGEGAALAGPGVAGREAPAPAGDAVAGRGVRAALAVLAGRPVLRATVTLAAVSIAMSGFTTAALYQLVIVDLGLAGAFLGVLASAQGAGSIVGGLVAGRVMARNGLLRVAVIGTALFAAGLLARCLPWWPGLVAGSVIAGVALPWTLVAAVTAVQTHTPPGLLGRVAATANTAMFGPIALAIPLGSAVVGLGGRPILLVAAGTCLAAVAVVRRALAQPAAVADHDRARA